MSCLGPLEQTRFLGASVIGVSAGVGWNGNASTLNVTVVEDTVNGDEFTKPVMGTPVKFEFNDFVFCGIISNWEEKHSTQGRLFDIVVIDPRDILDGIHLILEGYSGTTSSMYNLWNPFGWHESATTGGGFGSSQSNDSGMPWVKILEAMESIKDGSTNYGTKITFQGHEYDIDFDELPTTPDYYRISGNSSTLMQAITQVCNDAGYDVIVRLNINDDAENTISFKTVSRKTQPALNAIQAFVDSREDVVVKNKGQELRNEPTSAFVVGGNRQRLWRTSAAGPNIFGQTNSGELQPIWPYWGLNRTGSVIIGQGYGDDHTFTVPCDVEGLELLGGSYTMKVAELRAASAGIDEWRAYLAHYRTAVANALGITSPTSFTNDLLSLINNGRATATDIQNLTKTALQACQDDILLYRTDKLYTFVKAYVDNYYGKQFMVSVPFVVATIQSETGQIITTSEPSDGGWLEPGENPQLTPLLLPTFYEDLFTHEDGRYRPFVRFDNLNWYDLSNYSNKDAVVSDFRLFVKCEMEPYFVYAYDFFEYSPRVVIKLPAPVYSRANEQRPPHLELLIKILEDNGAPQTTVDTLRDRWVQFPNATAYGPAANMPWHAAVPLKSNVLTYGPWYVIGPAGKVNYEKDDSLVPWNYGGYFGLNLAGEAKVENAMTSQISGETGSIEVPGTPDIQLGDELVANGPNVTDISISFAPDGVKTNYKLRTYTPSFGRFSKQNADRFQRLAINAMRIRRNMLSIIRSTSVFGYSIDAYNQRFITKDGPEFLGKSPHEMLLSTYFSTSEENSQCITSSAKLAEAVAAINGKTGVNYATTAAMSAEGLFRGYSVEENAVGIPHFMPKATKDGITEITFNHNNFDYFPFTGSSKGGLGRNTSTSSANATDVKVLSYGDIYPTDGIQTFKSSHDRTKARGIGLAGPVIVTGWGYDLLDKPVPNSDNDGGENDLPTVASNNFLTNWRQKPNKWKCGPVDLRWDQMRKVWTFPYIITGEYNGNSTMKVWKGLTSGTDTGLTIQLGSYFDISSVASGTKVLAYPIAGSFIIVAADCD